MTRSSPAEPPPSGDARRRFASLALENRVPLVAYLMRSGADRARAEDCAQEAFVRAYGDLRRLRSWETARGWLFGIARHVFLDDTRRCAVAREYGRRETGISVQAPLEAETALDGRRASLSVARAIERLEPPKPEILELHYGSGLLVEEIALALGMPESTVKTHLRRARMALRAQLVREGVQHA